MKFPDLGPAAKAVVAAVPVAVAAVVAASQSGSPGGSAITPLEWVLVGVSAVVGHQVTYWMPNKP